MKKHVKPTMKILLLQAGVVSSLIFGAQAHADESNVCSSTVVDLNAMAEIEIKNDLAGFSWQVTEESTSPNLAMQAVTATLERAVSTLKQFSAASNVRTNYQSYPINGNDRKVSHWRVTGTLSYELPLSQLEKGKLPELPASLGLQRINYFLSKAKKAQYGEQLIQQAIANFQGKAKLVANALGKADVQIIRMNLQDNGYQTPQPVMFRAMAADMESSSKVVAEGGQSELTVQVNGQVCVR